MKRIAALAFVSLAVIPLHSLARVEAITCPVSHFLRGGGTEIRTTAISLRNADLENAARVERLTIRNVFGAIIHDSGPAIGVPLPRNRSFASESSPDGLDVTDVPPGASYFLTTTDIWGLASVPTGNSSGFTMSATVQFSKEGKSDLFVVGVRQRSRDLFQTIPLPPEAPVFFEGAERSSNIAHCISVRPTI